MLCIYNTLNIKYNFTNSPNADQEEWMLALQGSMKCTSFLFIHTYLCIFFVFLRKCVATYSKLNEKFKIIEFPFFPHPNVCHFSVENLQIA